MREMKEQNFTWNLQSINMENHGKFNGYFWVNKEKNYKIIGGSYEKCHGNSG